MVGVGLVPASVAVSQMEKILNFFIAAHSVSSFTEYIVEFSSANRTVFRWFKK